MRIRTLAVGPVFAAIVAGVVLGGSTALAHGAGEEGEPSPEPAYVLEGDLTPELAIPGPGPDSAGAFPTFTVWPEVGELCYDVGWDQMDEPTEIIIRLDVHDLSSVDAVDAIDIDFAVSTPAELDRHPGGGLVTGCIQVEPDVLEFLVHEAELSHVTVYTEEHPQGAAGGFLRLTSAPGLEPDDSENEGPFEAITSVLIASLDVDSVVPTQVDTVGSGEAVLEVTPQQSVICWNITWELAEPATAIHLHVEGPGGVDPEPFRLDFLREGHEFGSAGSDFTEGCPSVFGVVDFEALVADPERHYIDIHTDAHPDGALRGRLFLENDFVTSLDGHDDEEETGRGLPDLVPHILALLVVLAVAAFGVVRLRRSRGLYDAPPSSAVAVASSAFTALVISVALMILDVPLAPAGNGTTLCSDYDRYAALGVLLAVIAFIGGVATIALARRSRPLRGIATGIVLGAVVVWVAWLLWIPPQGCSVAADERPIAGVTDVVGDLLDCNDRVYMHGDPDYSFEGFATPAEAVGASPAAELGETEHFEGRDWLVEADGRYVAIITAGDWRDDRFVAFDMVVCSDKASLLGY